MRRSDMVIKIQDMLNSGYDPNHTEHQASEFLSGLEKLGIKPPRLPEEYCQAIMSVYYAGYSFHQWEEEIEKDEQVMKALNRRRELNESRKRNS